MENTITERDRNLVIARNLGLENVRHLNGATLAKRIREQKEKRGANRERAQIVKTRRQEASVRAWITRKAATNQELVLIRKARLQDAARRGWESRRKAS